MARFLGQFRAEGRVCAVDTEADSLHSYKEKLCLIQFSCEGEHRLIDPLKITDFAPLLEFLDGTELWMHGADFDMSILKRTFGVIPPVVLDTQVAARLVGYRKFGLAHIIEEFFDVKLSKHSQRADWGKRPLPDKMVEYALNDVRYILPLREILVERLQTLGRYEWFVQSCDSAREAVIERPEKPEDKVWRISGCGKLSRLGLAYVRELWNWRDREAMELDRPAFKVIGNDHLLQTAIKLEAGAKSVKFPGRHRASAQDRFHQAIARVRKMPRDEWPEKTAGLRQAREPGFAARFEALKRRRNQQAEALDLDETLIASKSVLERLALNATRPEEVLLPWQRELLYGGE